MLTEKDVAHRLAEAESVESLYAYVVDGIPAWRLLRGVVAVRLLKLGLSVQSTLRPLPLLVRTLSSLLGYLQGLAGKKAHYIVKSYSSALRTEQGGRYEDMYFDDLLKHVPGGSKWSFCNSATYAEREAHADIPIALDTTFIQVAATILARLLPRRTDLEQCSGLAQALARSFGDGMPTATQIRFACDKFRWQVKLYAVLLSRQRPRAVIVATNGEYALLRAAQQQGIRFIELQHGIFTPDHHDALPAASLEQTQANLLLPDVFAVYGDYWRELLADTAMGRLGRVMPCGCAAIEKDRKAGAGDSACRELPRILVTTQGISVPELVGFLDAFLKRSTTRFELLIKPHPTYDERRPYKELARDERVELLTPDDACSTNQLIISADLHLSISSACHYDALALGTPTMVLGLPGHELMLPLVASGDVRLLSSVDELVEAIDSAGFSQLSSGKTDRFCRYGFVVHVAEAASISP